MLLHIQTQYRENYGAHSWDGKGSCPQYWKNKGGDDYLVDLNGIAESLNCLLYTSPSPRDRQKTRMPSSA